MTVTPEFLRNLVEEIESEVQEDVVKEAIEWLDEELKAVAMKRETAYCCELRDLALTSSVVSSVDEITTGTLEKIKQHYTDLGFSVWEGLVGCFYIGWS